MRADCMRCILSQPNDGAAGKDPKNWYWPTDFECAMGMLDFPAHAHICMEYIQIDEVMDYGEITKPDL